MDLQQMRYVVAIAETGSFTRAAARNFVVQSALSHQVAALERELGVQLFVRSSRQVKLTEAGQAFLPHARAALEAAERARDEAAAADGAVRGKLRIGFIPTLTAVGLPALLRECRSRFPDLMLEARVSNSEEMIQEVRNGTLDVAFLGLLDGTFPAAAVGKGTVQGVAVRELNRDTLAAVLSEDHPLARRKKLSLKELAEEAFADFPRISARAEAERRRVRPGRRRTPGRLRAGLDRTHAGTDRQRARGHPAAQPLRRAAAGSGGGTRQGRDRAARIPHLGPAEPQPGGARVHGAGGGVCRTSLTAASTQVLTPLPLWKGSGPATARSG